MNPKKIILIAVFLFGAGITVYPQLEVGIPISLNEKDAAANGYFNPYNNTFVLEQQHKGVITRLLYDTLFNLKQKYTSGTDSFSLQQKGRLPFLLKEYCTADAVYEVYGNRKSIQVWQLSFEKGTDTKAASLPLQEYYKDERLVAILPGENRLSFLSFSAKQNKLLLYNYFPGRTFLLQREYNLPKIPLTETEIKERGKFLAADYSNSLRNLFVSNLKNPSSYQVNTDGQLLYNDTAIFIVLKTPYNAGHHLLQLQRLTGEVSFTNFLVNRLVPDRFNTPLEKIPVATGYDSLLVIQSSNALQLEYYFYNLNTKALLAKYEADGDNSLHTLVHSDLRQVGTYGSKDEEKEITKERIFLRRKNKGSIFLMAGKTDGDSLLLSFGSYVPTAGIEGAFIRATTYVASTMLLAPVVGIMSAMPYLTMSRNKFLFACSKFSLQTLQPSTAQNIRTQLDLIATDKRVDDLEKKSSFIIEKNNRLYVGIFNREKDKYDIIIY